MERRKNSKSDRLRVNPIASVDVELLIDPNFLHLNQDLCLHLHVQ